ncbi:MAG: L-serine ammonia-lyase [Ancrocorticia sp.]|uniref:L-serine ammonia-lyase n=3 Tax=Ancrocorticia sp. TaxID=2593684 RepID=UPI003F8F1B8E
MEPAAAGDSEPTPVGAQGPESVSTGDSHSDELGRTLNGRPLSVRDMFRVGIGPSSSHTVGPMRAGNHFARKLACVGRVPSRVTIELMGSLGATGKGHSTDRAVLLGLGGFLPESVPVAVVDTYMEKVAEARELSIQGVGAVPINLERDVMFLPGKILPFHVNALTITAFGEDGNAIAAGTYYSTGGGFVSEEIGEPEGECRVRQLDSSEPEAAGPAPYPYTTAKELLKLCERNGLRLSELVMANETAALPADAVESYMDTIWQTMDECIKEGCQASGTLPGILRVKRRAGELNAHLTRTRGDDPLAGMDWVNLYALAVNEENAAGHRVVTAPTNGAAGVVPAVLAYYLRFVPDAGVEGQRQFLLAAAAIGGLIRNNASIAGAEVGCQGEVGAASAMAAAGLAEAMGGSVLQVENAAEIAMEHSLGLTCDPVAGLVQIPCIERNAIAAVKAINAARMALWGDGRHAVSFDTVIETMRQTGKDMLSKYKETSQGGLAVNVVEC